MRRLNARILSTASFAAFVAAGFAGPAYASTAQDEQAPACETLPEGPERDACLSGEVELESGEEAEGTGQNIQVTGTRIRRPNLESNVPITSVGIEELTDTGDVSLGDQLNDLPSLRSTFSTGNSGRFIGTAGLSLLDLRGLGTSRTLVLVNNRRHVTGSVGSRDVDVNTIPIDLVERVDIVTGGNSAVYGSDAIAGVVNFILRRDFDGIRARGQMGISERGDANRHFVSLTAGRNFAADRGNIAIALEYAKQDPLYFTDRDEITGAFSGRCQYNLAEITTGEGADNSDDIPDNERFCGVRNANIYDPGQITIVGSCATLTGAAFTARCLPSGQPRLFFFDPQGNLVEDQIVGVDFREFGSGNSQTLNGSTLRNTGQLAVGVERYNANLLAHFDVSEALRPFFEAKFTRVNTIQEGQPSFVQGFLSSFFGGDLSDNLRCDNAFITPQARAQLQAIGRCITNAAGAPVVRPGVNIFDFGDGTGPVEIFPINRFNIDFGGRGELGERDTYRVVAGVEGDFNEDWHYEASINYGRVRTRLQSLNNLLTEEFLNATNAAVGPGGTPVCRINIDNDPDNNDPNCVPLNIFGLGAPSQAALDYVNITSTRRQRASQLQALAFVSGDSSQLFELPGGPIRFAVGAEYRRDTAFSKWSPEVEAGETFLNAIQEFNPPADEVYEAFGEISLPILRDLPFAQELTVEAAARVSHYEAGNTGTVYAYNVGGTWAPVRDIRFRANYSTSVRAPTLGDLFSPQSQNFAFIADPCDILNINNPARPNRPANCAAAGIPAGFVNTPARSASTSFLQGGNPGLTEEEGKSLTIGAIIQPRWVPGLALTIDYYDIAIDSLISTLTAQTIINQCYDDPGGIDNAFCAIVFRDPATNFFAQPVATIAGPVNFAAFDARGIDFELSYRRTFANGHRLNLRGVATRVLENTAYLDPTDPTFGNRFRSEIGDPSWAGNLNVNYVFDRYEFTYNLNYIGRQINAGLAYETLFPFQGRPPSNPDSIPANERWTPDVFYHSIRLGIRVNEDFTFYTGVDNIADRLPPFGQLGTAGGEPWETFGRRFYAGVNVNFR